MSHDAEGGKTVQWTVLSGERRERKRRAGGMFAYLPVKDVMKAGIIAGCTVLLLAAGISAASAEQQWNCKYHNAGVGRPGPDLPFKLIENTTSLDAHLDDLAGMVTHFRIIQNSNDGLIAVVPELPGRLSLQAFLLDKRKGDMKMTLTMMGSYEENYLGKCARSSK